MVNPQTKADRDVEALVVASLRRAFPGLTIIGEESSDGHDIPGIYMGALRLSLSARRPEVPHPCIRVRCSQVFLSECEFLPAAIAANIPQEPCATARMAES